MADLREVIYGGNTFTIPSGGEVPSLQQIYNTHGDLTVEGSADLYVYDGDGASGRYGVSGARVDSGTDLYTDIDAGSVTVGWNDLPCITLSGNYDASVTPAVAGGSVSMSPKMRESFRQVLGIDTLEAELAAKEARIAALEALLADHADVRLTLTDANGGSTAYDVLGKEYVAPAPQNMFELPSGAYDVNGNLLKSLDDFTSEDWIHDTGGALSGGYVMRGIDASRLPVGTAGLVIGEISDGQGGTLFLDFMHGTGRRLFENETSGQLDWLVVQDTCRYIDANDGESGDDWPDPIALASDFITDTIYYKGTATGAPWGQTSATVNTTGLPLAWA